MARAGQSLVEIPWIANPFKGDAFEEAWTPAAEAALKYGASGYLFLRSKDDLLKFMQLAFFETKLDFERYWYSEEISEYRALAAGLFQVPVLPVWHGVISAAEIEALSAG
jgi:hypothetical protein